MVPPPVIVIRPPNASDLNNEGRFSVATAFDLQPAVTLVNPKAANRRLSLSPHIGRMTPRIEHEFASAR